MVEPSPVRIKTRKTRNSLFCHQPVKEEISKLTASNSLTTGGFVINNDDTYTNTVKILCEAFRVEFETTAFKCERRLIEQAFSHNHTGKMLVTIIDDAHLLTPEVMAEADLYVLCRYATHDLKAALKHVASAHYQCPVCDKWFAPQRESGKYCSPACRTSAWRERKALEFGA